MSPALFAVGLLAAFLVGFMLGRISGAIALEKDPTREVAVDVKDVGRKLDRFNRGPWVGTIAAFIIIAIGVQAGISAQQRKGDTARIAAATAAAAASAAQVKQLGLCVAEYENQLSAALPPVRKAAHANDEADIEFKRAVLKLFVPGANKGDAASVKRALAHNIAVYERLSRVRAENPYPTPPKKVCPHE